MAVARSIQRLGEKFADLALKYIPDPYVLVIGLTVLAFVGELLTESLYRSCDCHDIL
jgi:short subunit fatty acids transporter